MEILKTERRKVLIFVSVPLDLELGMTEIVIYLKVTPFSLFLDVIGTLKHL